MSEKIVLVNFNSYLGGGETLLVRFASFLQEKGADFSIFCLKDSYIREDLKKRGVNDSRILALDADPNFYYLNNDGRKEFISKMISHVQDNDKLYRFVTFCMRDLYSVVSRSPKVSKIAITHLILHVEDDLYVGQSLINKFEYKFFGNRKFSSNETIDFNRNLMKLVNSKKGLISMSDVICKVWNRNFGIKITDSKIVPLPSFKDDANVEFKAENSKKIIWIGRIVDFKIPSLIEMIKYVSKSKDYSLTVVGAGDKDKIDSYIKKNNVDVSKINFIGQVSYGDLANIIKEHSIGYAMGTSLVELAKFKIPVIVALASFDHKLLTREICGGLFYNKYKGCDGTDLMIASQDEIKWTIDGTINEIEKDYLGASKHCHEYAKRDFSEEENFSSYLNIIKNTEVLEEESKKIEVPSSPKLRSILFNYIKDDQ